MDQPFFDLYKYSAFQPSFRLTSIIKSTTSMLNFTLIDFPEADVALKTSDGVLLFAHMAILRVASTFFRGDHR
jgi:hypothetical protein